MIELYRRHAQECEAKLQEKGLTAQEISDYKRCDCGVWMKGQDLNGKYIRESCKTRDWAKAGRIVAERNGLAPTRTAPAPTVDTPLYLSRDKWLADKIRAKSTKRLYRQKTRVLIEHLNAAKPPVQFIREITRDHIVDKRDQLREKWQASTVNLYRTIWLEWLDYCQSQEWGGKEWINPVQKTTPDQILEKFRPTMPLDEEGDEVWQLVHRSLAPFLETRKPVSGESFIRRPESFIALIELLYHTGLRISDGIRFDPDKIKGSKFMKGYGTYRTPQTKTHNEVTILLEPWLWTKLRELPPLSPDGYVFWDGRNGDGKASWEYYIHHQIRKPFRHLGFTLGMTGKNTLRLHRLRDSFAVNQLNQDVKIEDLQEMLGHKSLATTEKYYKPWVISRTTNLERRVYAARAQAAQQIAAQAPVIDIATRIAERLAG